MSTQLRESAEWEVEGFIDRLTKRDDSNSERLVLEAIAHLRAFSCDCDALHDSNRELRARAEHLEDVLRKVDDWYRVNGGGGPTYTNQFPISDVRAAFASADQTEGKRT